MSTELKIASAQACARSTARECLGNCGRVVGIGLELAKARVSLMVIATTALGFLMASWPDIDIWLMLQALAATGFMSGGAAALNQIIEKDYDRLMTRTAKRPLPSGRMRSSTALVFGCLLGLVGFAWLIISVNTLTAILGAITFLLYVGVYTPLKRYTIWNTVIGAIPGAIPPMMGWTAVKDQVDIEAWLLFMILFCWQMPHFYAIAWLNRDDYRRAGYRMLSHHDESGKSVGVHSVVFALALLVFSIGLMSLTVDWSAGVPAFFFVAMAILVGCYFLFEAVEFLRNRDRSQARRLFFASIIYIPWVSAALFAATIFCHSARTLAGGL